VRSLVPLFLFKLQNEFIETKELIKVKKGKAMPVTGREDP
jgi:hypothetical protein